MIEAREQARQLSPAPSETEVALAGLARNCPTHRDHLPELLRRQEGQYVLIKGLDVGGAVFRDRSEALREGYQRFGRALPGSADRRLRARGLSAQRGALSRCHAWRHPSAGTGPSSTSGIRRGPEHEEALKARGLQASGLCRDPGLLDTVVQMTAIQQSLAQGIDLPVHDWVRLRSSVLGAEERDAPVYLMCMTFGPIEAPDPPKWRIISSVGVTVVLPVLLSSSVRICSAVSLHLRRP